MQDVTTDTDTQTEAPAETPKAHSLRQLEPVSVNVIGDIDGDSVEILFAKLAGWDATELLQIVTERAGLEPDSAIVDGNSVTFHVSDDSDADEVTDALRRILKPRYSYSARAAVVELPSVCGCGTEDYIGEISLDTVLPQSEVDAIKRQLTTTRGVETVLLGGRQLIRIVPTRFAMADTNSVRRVIQRVCRMLNIELLDEIEVESAPEPSLSGSPIGGILASIIAGSSPFGRSPLDGPGDGMPRGLAILSNLIGGFPGFAGGPGSNGAGRRSGGLGGPFG